MPAIDIQNYDRAFKRELELLEESDLPERTKELLKEFIDDALHGWGTRKISKARAAKLLSHLRHIAFMLHEKGYDFEYLTEEGVKYISKRIDEHFYERKKKRGVDPEKPGWGEYDFKRALLKFMKWLRAEKGYPEDYPDREIVEAAKVILKMGNARPPELAKMQIVTPEESVKAEDIPPAWVFRALRESAENIRDEAFFAVAEEWGARIGGIGGLMIKQVRFDDFGAWIYPEDKTHRGEPVRLVWSAKLLKRWLDVHPFKDNPDAPVWIDLNCKDYPKPITYNGFRKMIQRAIRRHNKKAEASGGKIPKIEKNIRTHFFRYFAQIRDEIEGVPRSVQIRQRGWSPNSKQPDRYAKLAPVHVDEYFRKKYGKQDENGKDFEPVRCPRCEEINPPAAKTCVRCGLPLDARERYDVDKSREVLKELLRMFLTGKADPERIQKMLEEL